MARRNPLAMLVGIAAVAAALAQHVAVVRTERGPLRIRRRLTKAEARRLDQVRDHLRQDLPNSFPGLDPEDAARIAMAYPACWAFTPRKH